MSVDSYTFGEIQREVESHVRRGAITESERCSWISRLTKDPGAVNQLRQAKVPTPTFDEPEPPPREARSGGEKLQEWLEQQADWGKPSADPIPPRPEWYPPQSCANSTSLDVIRRLPWQVQKLVARMDQASAHAAVERFTGPGGDIEAEVAAMSGGEAYADVLEYANEVQAWRNDPAVPLAEAQADAARGLQPPATVVPSSAYTAVVPRRPWADRSGGTRCTPSCGS